MSTHDAQLASLEAALNLLAEMLEQPREIQDDTDLINEINRLRANQAEAKNALDEATAIMRTLLNNSEG